MTGPDGSGDESTAHVAQPAQAPSPKLLFVGSSGRSGSTLFDLVVGRVPGFVAVGEAGRLWVAGRVDRLVCGCGAPVRDCAFWTEVAYRAFGGWSSPDHARAVRLRPTLVRSRHLPLLLRPGSGRNFQRRATEFGEIADRFYTAIAEVAGAEVVVDSSKEAGYAALLQRSLGARFRLVHLVRDPKGVAYSWTKVLAKPLAPPAASGGLPAGPPAELHRFSPRVSALRWVAFNRFLDHLAARSAKSVLVRYETFVADPAGQLQQVETVVDRAPSSSYRHLRGNSVTVAVEHTVAGNPMRINAGGLTLRLDEQWRSGLTARQQRSIDRITRPLQRKYGYGDASRIWPATVRGCARLSQLSGRISGFDFPAGDRSNSGAER